MVAQILISPAEPYAKEIKEIFDKIDDEATGRVVPAAGTLSHDVLVFYYEGMGLEYDDETLTQWHKAHATGEAGLGLESFGRFLAELAQVRLGLSCVVGMKNSPRDDP